MIIHKIKIYVFENISFLVFYEILTKYTQTFTLRIMQLAKRCYWTLIQS